MCASASLCERLVVVLRGLRGEGEARALRFVAEGRHAPSLPQDSHREGSC
jgi:hypothetical protein